MHTLPHSKTVLMIVVRRWESSFKFFFFYISSMYSMFSKLSVYCSFGKKCDYKPENIIDVMLFFAQTSFLNLYFSLLITTHSVL